jgi:hypothetical protein
VARQNLEGKGSGALAGFGPGALAIVAVITLAFFGPMKPGSDTDSWWHLATGELILQERALPDTDPFSWSAEGRDWVLQEWGSEVIFAAIYSSAGAKGLVVLEGLIIGATALVLLRTLRRYTTDPYVLAGVVLVAVALSTMLWTIRPHLFTLLLFSVTLFMLTSYDDNPARVWWWLVPISAVWVNLHAASVLGLILIGIFAAVRSVAARRHDLWKLFAASALAGCINPEGPGIYLHPFRVVNASRRVLEWMPPDLHDPASLIYAASAIGSLVLLAIRQKRAPTELVIAAALFSLAGFGAMRNVPMAGIAFAPCLAIGLDGLLRDRSESSHREKSALGVIAVVVVLAGVASAVINVAGSSESELFREKVFPREATAALTASPPGRVANPWGWGGYLIFKAPGYPVSFDGRNDMYGLEIVNQQLLLEELRPGWDDYLEDNDVRYVLWQRTRPLAEALRLDEGWRLIHEDRLAVLFERVGS